MNLLARLFTGAFIAASLGLVLMAVLLARQEPPNPTPARSVVTWTVEQGGKFVLRNGLTAPTTCAALVYRSIYDSSGTRVFSESEYRPGLGSVAGSPVLAQRALPIPEYAALGTAQYRVIIEWQCNFMQRLFPQVRELPPLQFEIVPPKQGLSIMRSRSELAVANELAK